MRRVSLKGCPGGWLVELVDGVCPILENSTACQKSMPITSSRGLAWSVRLDGLGWFSERIILWLNRTSSLFELVVRLQSGFRALHRVQSLLILFSGVGV